MITFKYTDEYAPDGAVVNVELRSGAQTIGAVVEDFKRFLRHAGYHDDNVDAVTYNDSVEHQELPKHSAEPEQLELDLEEIP